jgi:hypothetical protein
MDAAVAGCFNGERRGWFKGSFTPVTVGQDFSLWLTAGNPGAAAAVGATNLNGIIPTDATAGAFPFTNAVLDNFLGGLTANGLAVGTLTLWDRLWFNWTTVATTGAQAITFPGLTRYTNGIGVEVWAEWYLVSGAATATNVTYTYTDQDNNSGQVNTSGVIMPAVTKNPGFIYRSSFLSGDSGCRAISSMNLTVTQTTGTWGLTMMKQIGAIPIRPTDQAASVMTALDCGFENIVDDACLFFTFQGAATANTVGGNLLIGKG